MSKGQFIDGLGMVCEYGRLDVGSGLNEQGTQIRPATEEELTEQALERLDEKKDK